MGSTLMVATLVGIMALILLFVGVLRILQSYATDVLDRRLFVRVTLFLARILPHYKKETFRSHSISRFFETVFMQRSPPSFLVDFTNVLVGGLIGMTLLVFYHPSFIVFDLVLLGSVVLIGIWVRRVAHDASNVCRQI